MVVSNVTIQWVNQSKVANSLKGVGRTMQHFNALEMLISLM